MSKVEQQKEFWNARAVQFASNQKVNEEPIPNAVAHWLEEQGALSEQHEWLEIGAGAGRYTIPFALRTKHVTATDISSEMLKHLTTFAEQFEISTITTVETGWPPTVAISPHDYTFAAMVPVIGSFESLQQMDDFSRKGVYIARFHRTSDQFIDGLPVEAQIQVFEGDPHNDVACIESIVDTATTLLGRTVQTKIFESITTDELTEEQAIARYAKLKERLPEVYAQLVNAVSPVAVQGKVQLERRVGLTVIYWEK